MEAEIILRIYLDDSVFKDNDQKKLFYKSTKEQQKDFLLNKALEDIENSNYSEIDLELIKIED